MTCPVPLTDYEHVLLGHGSGGKLTADLIQRVFLPDWATTSSRLEDQATVRLAPSRSRQRPQGRPALAFTTDSFVVRPLVLSRRRYRQAGRAWNGERSGGGRATPLFLSAAFILEEGLPMDDLRRIVASMRQACHEADVQLVTGDTKVVDHGKGDQIFITTSGIGLVPDGRAACRSAPRDREIASSSRARSAITASPSCRFAKGSNSKRCWKAIRHRSMV